MTHAEHEFAGKVGLLVREARLTRGWSSDRLADVAGVGVNTVWRIESGRGGTSVWVLWRVALALGVKVGRLVPKPEDAQ